jgi:hypothetical protein
MSTKHLLAAGLAAAAISVLAACGGPGAPADPAPATVKAIPGSSLKQVQLTEQAERRLGITTQPVRTATVSQSGRRATHKVIPYSAVVYDNDGSTWTYVNTTARTFVREPIAIDAIEGDVAVLDRGPAVGAAVVTVGAPELLGTEYDISGEQ